MCDEWMPTVVLPLSAEQFRQLPRNAAYKYERLGGHVVSCVLGSRLCDYS